MFLNFFMPYIPSNCDKPPTIYSILESIVNGDKDEDEDQTKIKDLAKEGRHTIFDFYYPLSANVDKEYFETMILNHYMTRRIGFDTCTNFKLHLNVKLNAIMPKYNVLFDNYANIMNGNTITKEGTDNSQTNTSNKTTNSNKANNIADNRFSDTPQNEIQDVKDGKYVSDYTYTQSDTISNGESESNGQGKNDRQYNEIITEKNINENYLKLQNEMNNVFEMIFKDLDCLFYSIV